jgi:hypothetical protein
MPTLEVVILSNGEGQMGVDPEIVAALAATPAYRERFEHAFDGPPSGLRFAEALAAFVRALSPAAPPFAAGSADTPTRPAPVPP